MNKTIFLSTLLLFIEVSAYSQLFDLNSIIIDSVLSNKWTEILKRDIEGNNGRLPILVSPDLVTLFDLKDTIVDGLKINFFNTVKEMADLYELKKNGQPFFIGSIHLKKVSSGEVNLHLYYGSFKCDKWLFRHWKPFVESNGYTLIKYRNKSLGNGEIDVKNVTF
jgi:hypothetical protein